VPPCANCGVGFFRQVNPLEWLVKKGLIEVKQYGYDSGQNHLGNPPLEFLEEWGKWADLLFFGRNDTPQYLSLMCGTAQNFGIPAVIDYDDNVQAVRPYNPGYPSFAPNSEAKRWNIITLEKTQGLTVSTDNLVEVYKEYAKNIYVCPNSIDFEFRDKFLGSTIEIPKKEGEIRIGWAGSAAHWENLNFIEPVIYDIMDKYKNVTFSFTGIYGDLFNRDDLKDRMIKTKFVDLDKWPEYLVKCGFDIAVAPLVDNLFNRAKSNLRCIEYQACKYPIVAGYVEPYKYIKNGISGFLAKEREDYYFYIEKLILNEKIRKEMGEAGYNQAKDYYNMEKNCEKWLEAFNDIIDKFKNKKS
jgi:glycosyltransferase involved in cell wall biosynthesis